MKLPKFIRNNLILKITSLNSLVVGARLLMSLVVQKLLAEYTGQAGIAKVGQLRNISSILMSLTSLGTFNGVVKYVSEYKSDQKNLLKLFSTLYVFSFTASVVLFFILFFGASYFSHKLFLSDTYAVVFKLMAVAVPFISMNRIFSGVINGISDYKKHTKIEFISHFLAAVLLLVSLYFYSLKGVLVAIALTPIIQFAVLIIIFGKLLKDYVDFKSITFKIPFLKQLLGFTAMSFVATVLSNYVEIDLRTLILDRISEAEAGSWTAMNSISKIYMQFLIAIFSLYILPKYATINTSFEFRIEIKKIYTSLVPLVFIGMVLVYVLRNVLIEVIFTDAFMGMAILFKWQLAGDFVRFIANVLSYQFLAKKQIKYFVSTQLIGLAMYYVFGRYYLSSFGTEGVVMALFVSNLIYLGIVFFVLRNTFFGKNRDI
ncbi:O-antigen translocase [Formosa sp. Hel1_33_131]|uniref:O-antigen translocase n=1 Tax=Formosa sp. Hel1_33_131 TaxID=1336794 RepID=UPI00084E1621|nr:O-antigen translocase [Formosa sp. Hel1_33_131]